MKIMLFHPPGEISRETIKSFGAMRAYYLEREFRKLGVELVVCKSMRNSRLNDDEIIRYHQDLDISGIDHFIGEGVRYWSFLPFAAGEALRARLGRYQCLAQIHDVTLLDRTSADVTFTHRNSRTEYPPGSPHHERYERHTCYVGWAADGELCYPNQSEDELRILVDHPTYGYNSRDSTLSILLNLRELVAKPELWNHRFKTIKVRQLVDGAVVDVDFSRELLVRPFKRQAIPYLEVCAEYSRAHMFFVTHSESLGQAAIEAATAGALVVAPENCIAADRLATIRHFEWSDYIRWKSVMPHLDVKASRETAVQNSWTNVAEKIVDYLKNFDRSKVGWAQTS